MSDYAWAAGFFDGEGSVYLKPYKRRHMPRIGASNNVREPIDRLAVLFGGSVWLRGAQDGKRRGIWTWELNGAKRVRPALEAMLPYLLVKREQAEVMLAYVSEIGPGGKRLSEEQLETRDEIRLRLSALKGRDGSRRHLALP